MSRRFGGGIRQLGYVVRDIEAAMRHWTKMLEVGPWFYAERFPVENFRYRGAPSAVEVSIALSYSGGMQVELIQQRNGAPSMYRDFLEAGHEGLQHVCYCVADVQADLARALADGYTVGQSGDTARGPFYYLETGGQPGTVVEIVELTPARRRVFAAIKAACDGWDGTAPIRAGWPQ